MKNTTVKKNPFTKMKLVPFDSSFYSHPATSSQKKNKRKKKRKTKKQKRNNLSKQKKKKKIPHWLKLYK
jgi:hypothetical protein